MSKNGSNGVEKKPNQDLICDEDDVDETFDRSLLKEAQRIVEEIKFGVARAELSSVLESNDSIAYINIRTLENDDYCVELSSSGYMIVGREFDRVDDDESVDKRFETCEALMHQISPAFVKKFNISVAERLNSIDPTTS